MRFPKPWADAVARLRVPSGFLLVAAFAWFAEPTTTSVLASLPVSLAGLWLRAWAAGHLAKNRTLAVSGPYAWVRNPLYVGTLLVAAGLVVAARQWGLAALFAVIFLFVYLPVIQNEERHLRNLFPEYETYAQRVPALIPRRPRERGDAHFRGWLYTKNQEYQALFGYLAGVALLIWKALR